MTLQEALWLFLGICIGLIVGISMGVGQFKKGFRDGLKMHGLLEQFEDQEREIDKRI